MTVHIGKVSYKQLSSQKNVCDSPGLHGLSRVKSFEDMTVSDFSINKLLNLPHDSRLFNKLQIFRSLPCTNYEKLLRVHAEEILFLIFFYNISLKLKSSGIIYNINNESLIVPYAYFEVTPLCSKI